jgi:uncharacterized membrane protein
MIRSLAGLIAFLSIAAPLNAYAAMSFCNRTSGPIEAAIGYREDNDNNTQGFVSEGWWRIEHDQCARVYGQPLTRFYYYYAHALTQTTKNTPPMTWSGKYIFCTDDKAFHITGDGDCPSRNFQSTGFAELDLGANTRDYTLDFKDNGGR